MPVAREQINCGRPAGSMVGGPQLRPSVHDPGAPSAINNVPLELVNERDLAIQVVGSDGGIVGRMRHQSQSVLHPVR